MSTLARSETGPREPHGPKYGPFFEYRTSRGLTEVCKMGRILGRAAHVFP